MRFVLNAWVLLLLLPFTGAVSISNTTINTSVSHTFLNISGFTIDAAQVDINNQSITFSNLTYNVTGANMSIPVLNLTTQDSVTNSWQLPNTSSSTRNIITLRNGLSQSVSSVVVTIGAGGVIPSAPTITYPNLTSQSLNSSTSLPLVTLTIPSLPNGASIVTLDTLNPVLTITGPGNVSSDTDGTLNFTFTPTDANLANCSLLSQAGTVYGTNSNLTNGSVNNITITGVNATSPLAGSPIFWQIICFDNVGHNTTSGTYQLTTVAAGETASTGGNPGVGTVPGMNSSNVTNGTFEMEPVEESVASAFFDKGFYQLLAVAALVGLLVFAVVKQRSG